MTDETSRPQQERGLRRLSLISVGAALLLGAGVLLALGPQDPAQGKRERGDAAADLGRSAGGEEKPPPGVLKGHQATVAAASFSADGRRVLTISYDKTARV